MTTTDQGRAASCEGTAQETAQLRSDALVERLLGALIGGIELLTIDLGRRLGLYGVLRDHGALTSSQLAERADIAERYAREWLEQQAAAGLLDVAQETGEALSRRFRLPDEHATVLLDEEDSAYFMGAAPQLTGLACAVPALVEAYRSGGGVAYTAFGTDISHGIAAFNRPIFVADLENWLATMPDVVDRLHAGGDVLDAGCGLGWSAITLARAFARVRVHGVDLDAASVREARLNAVRAGVADRVAFEVADVAGLAADTESGGPGRRYQLACVFEALHDMGEPIEALRRIGAVLAPDAPVLVADERTADTYTAPADDVERFQYGYSVLSCLPATMAESPTVANGTVLRAPTLRAWAEQAGFTSVTVLPVENDFWRLYRLDR